MAEAVHLGKSIFTAKNAKRCSRRPGGEKAEEIFTQIERRRWPRKKDERNAWRGMPVSVERKWW
jgi:hypothetical protein